MYIAEIAPAKYRGQFVAINQLTIVIGILAAQIANYLIAEPIPETLSSAGILESWNGQAGWRYMFWAELIPAGAFFLLMFFVPKSPRFLVKIKEDARAQKVLGKIGGLEYAKQELKNIQLTLQQSSKRKINFSDFSNPKGKTYNNYRDSSSGFSAVVWDQYYFQLCRRNLYSGRLQCR